MLHTFVHTCLVPPQVVGALLDAEASEEFLSNLILSVRSLLPVDALVDEVEKRHRCAHVCEWESHLAGVRDVKFDVLPLKDKETI